MALAFFRYFHTRSTFGSAIIVNFPVVYNEPRPRVHARRDGGERPEQYMIMQLELAPAQHGTA